MGNDRSPNARTHQLPCAVPDVTRGHLALDGCVSLENVHSSEIVQVVLWHCLCEGESLRSERSHSNHVLAISLDGACCLHDGPRGFVVDPASAVLHRPGSAYRTTHPFGCDDTGVNIAFRDDVAREAFESHHFKPDGPAVTIAMRPMRLALGQLVLALRSRCGLEADPVAMDEIALELLSAAVSRSPMASDATREQTRADHREISESARGYLNEHFRKSVRLDEVAHAVGASPFHLARVFRQHTGLALRGYLQRLRLGAAVHALAQGEESITQIALGAGFASHAHLSAVFARELGVAPSEFRSLVRRGRGADIRRFSRIGRSSTAVHRP